MEWREEDGLRWLEAELPGARAAFSTRLGGVSMAPYDALNIATMTGDDRDRVRENRSRLALALGREPEGVVMGRQVHGAELRVHDEPQEPRVYADVVKAPDEVDAHSTANTALTPLVMVADCLPVALAGPGGVAMAHCGWRGLAGGIVARALEAVDARRPRSVPGSGPAATRSGRRFSPSSRTSTESRAAECSTCPRWRRSAGARRGGGTEAGGLCTKCNPELFYSHRRDGERTGRQAGLAWTNDGRARDRSESSTGSARTSRGSASRRAPDVEILAATKYVPGGGDGGAGGGRRELVGENRLQDLEEKQERWGEAFTWDFIGNLQSRKVKRSCRWCG